MGEETETLLVIPADALPELLRAWLAEWRDRALVASVELLADGRLVVQVLPEVDPQFVARMRRMIAQYEDVLRRLT